MAPKTTAKKQAVLVAGHPRRSVDSVAEFIGSSLGELMNRKDALVKQLASVEKQIAAASGGVVVAGRKTASAARQAVTSVAGKAAAAKPAAAKPAAAATVAKKGNGKQKRPLPPRGWSDPNRSSGWIVCAKISRATAAPSCGSSRAAGPQKRPTSLGG